MARVYSFAPIAGKNAETLILGSMPGNASLAAGEYYAHPQNAFWRILCDLLAVDREASYPERIAALKSARIALWDVLQSCLREGSLDANIQAERQYANDFPAFFRQHKNIKRVFFNGGKAEACFRKHVAKGVETGSISFLRLPSTSPAHASLSYAQKLSAWRAIRQPVAGARTTRSAAS